MAFHLHPIPHEAGHCYLKITILCLLSLGVSSQDPTTQGATTIPGPTSGGPTPTYETVAASKQQTETPAATDSTLADCKLQIQVPESVKESFVDEDVNVNLVYADLKFENVDLDPQTGYLSSETKYVTPLRWALASGRRGTLLVQFPVTYQSLSLGSLSVGVSSTAMPVKADACPGFTSASDEAKQEAVAKALLESFNFTSDTDPVDFKVCQEFAHLPRVLAGDGTVIAFFLNIYFVIYNTHHECWTQEGDGIAVEVFRPPGWLTIPVVILGILGAVILPLQVLRFVQRTSSPYVEEVYEKDEKDNYVETGKVKKYYHRMTNLPVGGKYIIFTYSSPFALFLRFVAGCALIYIMLCPDVFFQLDINYYLRYDAFYRNEFINITNNWYHIARALILLLPLLWFLPTLPSIFKHEYKLRRFRFKDTPTAFPLAPYHSEWALERSYFGLFPFPHVQDHIPAHLMGEISGLSCLYYYMLQRIKTALRLRLLVRIYTHAFRRVWNGITTIMWPADFSTLWNVMSAVACVLTLVSSMPIVAVFNFIRLFFSTILYLLPSAYILLCITNTHYLIISFTNWAYKASILDRLSKLSDYQTSHTGAVPVATEDVAMEPVEDEKKEAGADEEEGEQGDPKESDPKECDPKETIVSFRGGRDGSGTACVEQISTLPKSQNLYITKWLPLPRFYSSLYEYMTPTDDEGVCPSLCLKILFVLVAFLMSVLILVVILVVGFIILLFLSLVIMVLSSIFIIYFLRILALCTLLSSVVVLSFTGLVINSLSVIPFCLLGLTLIGYVIGAWGGLYKTYANMLQTAIKIAKEVRPELCFVVVKTENKVGSKGTKETSPDDIKDEGTTEQTAPNDDEVNMEMEAMKSEKLVCLTDLEEKPSDIQAEVMVEEKLFWHVVEQVYPLRLQVMSIIIQNGVAILAAIVAIIVLVDIGELQDFQAFGVNLVVLVVTLVFTHISSLISVSKEEEEEDFRLGVRNAVIGFKKEEHDCK